MFRSKALKDFDDNKYSKLYSWWIETLMCKWWNAFVWFFQKPYRQLKKLIGWQLNVFRYDYDFDGHCLFAIIEYKLKRLEKNLLNGHAIQEDQDMKALRLAIKLGGRLKDDRYEDRFYDHHDKKWGQMKSWFTPIEGSTNSLWNTSRPKAVLPNEIEQERKEFRESYVAAEAKRNREQKWFFDILNKYLRRWWD